MQDNYGFKMNELQFEVLGILLTRHLLFHIDSSRMGSLKRKSLELRCLIIVIIAIAIAVISLSSLAVTGLGALLSSSELKRRYTSLQNEWMDE